MSEESSSKSSLLKVIVVAVVVVCVFVAYLGWSRSPYEGIIIDRWDEPDLTKGTPNPQQPRSNYKICLWKLECTDGQERIVEVPLLLWRQGDPGMKVKRTRFSRLPEIVIESSLIESHSHSHDVAADESSQSSVTDADTHADHAE